jgi:hypothetical protein
MARLPGLSYTSPLAELAAQDLLRRLNPRADFKRAGRSSSSPPCRR